MITVQVRVFNSLRHYMKGKRSYAQLTLTDGSTARQILEILRIPAEEVHLLMVNGQVPRGQMRNLNLVLHDQDRIALSGPLPFHRLYGAPVI